MGVVDVDRAAGRSGAYAGVWGMGPITMMHATSHASAGAYFWNHTQALRFTTTVTAHGKTLGAATFIRRFSSRALTRRSETLRARGFIATFVYPTGVTRRPAILLLGGSEGGIPGALSTSLAAQGYPSSPWRISRSRGCPARSRAYRWSTSLARCDGCTANPRSTPTA